MLENIFKHQPKYYEDMSCVVNGMIDVLSSLEERLNKYEDVRATQYGNQADNPFDAKHINGREAQEIFLFFYDMANTIKAFIDAFPKCSFVFFKSTVISKLVNCSERSLQSLLELIEVNRKKFKYVCREIKKCFLSIVSTIIQYGFVNRERSDEEDLASEFIQVIDSIGQCPRFLAEYYSLGNVDANFQIIEQLGLLDNASLDYAKSMLGSVFIKNDYQKLLRFFKIYYLANLLHLSINV